MTASIGELRPLFPAGTMLANPLVLESQEPNAPSINLSQLTTQHREAGLVEFGNSTLITFQNQPLAWIQPGNYSTQRHEQHFVDVAYVRPCTTISEQYTTGSMLDSESFDTAAEALLFIEELLAEVSE